MTCNDPFNRSENGSYADLVSNQALELWKAKCAIAQTTRQIVSHLSEVSKIALQNGIGFDDPEIIVKRISVTEPKPTGR